MNIQMAGIRSVKDALMCVECGVNIIGLLVGQRADMKAIKAGTNKCIVEAHFDISSYHLEQFFEENELEYENGACILRRELHISGKSRSFINDSPVSLSQLKEIGEKLIDVHSQHQNLLLNHEDFQLSILDILAHNEEDLITYKNLYGSNVIATSQKDR